MPAALTQAIPEQEFLDLMRYLLKLKSSGDPVPRTRGMRPGENPEMKTTQQDERIAAMTRFRLSDYVTKIEKKATVEVRQVLSWLTGFSADKPRP